jgi:hypothetical protein
MLLRLLLRKETLLLAGVTAAFAVPMFRSGELTFSKLAHWVANGIAPASEGPAESPANGYVIWSPAAGGQSEIPNLIPAASSQPSPLGQFLQSIFETQIVDSPETASAGPPLAATDLGNSPQAGASSAATQSTAGLPPTSAAGTSSIGPSANAASPANPLANWIPVLDLREVIRFDVSPYWVQQRWPQTTPLGGDADGYFGFRVPLVTDHRVGQLNGALTFFFDREAVVQRIQFQGTAADIAPLERLVTDHFRFVPVPDRPRLWAPIHQNVARGMLRFSEPIQSNARPEVRLREVAFEINSTQGTYQLSEAYRQLAVQ